MTRLDTNWLILPRQTMPPCFCTHGSTITFNNIRLLAETFKSYFAKKIKFQNRWGRNIIKRLWVLSYILSRFTHKGWRACQGVSIDSFTSLARSHASSPAVFWLKVNCTSESPSPVVCMFNSRASCGFCHCSHVIVFLKFQNQTLQFHVNLKL